MTIFSFVASLHQIFWRMSMRMGLKSCVQAEMVMQHNNVQYPMQNALTMHPSLSQCHVNYLLMRRAFRLRAKKNPKFDFRGSYYVHILVYS